MQKTIAITDAELDIMKVLWQQGALSSPEIFSLMENNDKSKSTLKTLLLRLVQKGAVRFEEINSRTYRYIPEITEEEYINHNSKNFINRVFDGSVQKMLLNFVKEEKITKADLERLIVQLEEE